MKYQFKQISWVILFAIAMGLLEAAVVVYLRALYYPNTTNLFPIQPMPESLAIVELSREAATILMLLAVGIISGKNRWSRFGYFLLSFGIWDIFYYVFLKLFIQWPESLFTWDILFLIPLPWFGPVLAPSLVALAMVVLGIIMANYENQTQALAFNWKEKLSMILGCLVILISFMMDSLSQIFNGQLKISDLNSISGLAQFVPDTYSWWMFLLGYLPMCFAIIFYYRRLKTGQQLIVN